MFTIKRYIVIKITKVKKRDVKKQENLLIYNYVKNFKGAY